MHHKLQTTPAAWRYSPQFAAPRFNILRPPLPAALVSRRTARLDRRIIMGMNRNLVIATLAQVERDIREGERHRSRQREIVADFSLAGDAVPFVAL
jgi:hypothetical protein